MSGGEFHHGIGDVEQAKEFWRGHLQQTAWFTVQFGESRFLVVNFP